MKFVDEYRDPALAKLLLAEIESLADDEEFKFMEVCGGHTHAIYRHGIEQILPPGIELVHGPGCPVCVIPMWRIDDAIAVAIEYPSNRAFVSQRAPIQHRALFLPVPAVQASRRGSHQRFGQLPNTGSHRSCLFSLND